MDELPISVMEALLKKAGATRVGESAKKELKELLEKKAEEITKKAIVFSNHAGRKTIREEDIELAKP